MSAPDIPSSYTITTQGNPARPITVDMTTGGGERPLAVNTTMTGTLNTTMNGTVSMRLDPMAVTTTILGDPDRPVATRMDVALDMRNMPHLTLNDLFDLIKALKKPNMRMTMPVEMNFGISVFPLTLLGLDALTFSVCGQQQLILDEYVPNAYERCEVDCPPCDG